jgi:hypothetical protein
MPDLTRSRTGMALRRSSARLRHVFGRHRYGLNSRPLVLGPETASSAKLREMHLRV